MREDLEPTNVFDDLQRPSRWPVTLCHLLGFSGLLIPFGNLLGPFFLWVLKKDSDQEMDQTGREVLSFQITMSLYFVGLGLLVFIPLLGGLFAIMIAPIYLVLFGCWVYLMIKAAVSAKRGEFFEYPLKIQMITDFLSARLEQ